MFNMQLAARLSNGKITGSSCQHLIYNHRTEATRLYAEPPPVHPADPWLHSKVHLKLLDQVCRWYNSGGSHQHLSEALGPKKNNLTFINPRKCFSLDHLEADVFFVKLSPPFLTVGLYRLFLQIGELHTDVFCVTVLKGNFRLSLIIWLGTLHCYYFGNKCINMYCMYSQVAFTGLDT